MLLREIHWDTAPPKGTPKLPDVLVVGQIAQWGRVIQHERGWRAQYAYPTHLYVLTEQAAIADRLRAHYKVPVAWGAKAERLRRTLPPAMPEAPAQPQPLAFPECLWTLTNFDAWPKALQDTLRKMLAFTANVGRNRLQVPLLTPPGGRITEAQKTLEGRAERPERRAARRSLALAAAEEQAMFHGNKLDARRALWIRLVRWRRAVLANVYEEITYSEREAPKRRDEVSSGIVPAGCRTSGKPYAATTLYQKQRSAEWHEQIAREKFHVGTGAR